MSLFKTVTVERPLSIFVWPLVKPTVGQLSEGGSVSFYTGPGGWYYRPTEDFVLGTIWTPMPGPELCNELTSADLELVPSKPFLAAVKDLKEGKFGTDLPPFRFPRYKPTADMVWKWSRGNRLWINAHTPILQPNDVWWPAGHAAHQLYGFPMSAPI